MNTAKALLQAVGVPGQVIVHHQMRALQVNTFAGGVSGQQHLNLGVVEKAFLGFAALFPPHGAVNHYHGLGATEKG